MEIGVKSEHGSHHFSEKAAAMVTDVFASEVDRGVLLMRHSARTFDPSIHDLLNKLTQHGRKLCSRLGEELPKDLTLKGYASPPSRCMETAEAIIQAHVDRGGAGARTRPVEALGVFYALDQQRMWKGLSSAPSLQHYVSQWFAGTVPGDVLIPAPLAVDLLLRVLQGKLQAPGAARQLDLCVTHDLTIYTVRHGVGLEAAPGAEVEFLDGLLLYERDSRLFMRDQRGNEVNL